MFPILQIGPLAIQTPGLILLLGLWLGLELAERSAARAGLPPNRIFNTALAMIAGGLLGGRLVYAAGNPQVFYDNPLDLFSISTQLLSPAGGLAFAIAAGLAYGRRVGLPLWPALDCLTSLLAALSAGQGLASIASGDAYGVPSDLPWAIYLWGANRHPTQVYDTLAALLAGFMTWPGVFQRWLKAAGHPGMRFWVFIGITAAARLFLEAFRAGGDLVLDQFRLAQLLAWLVLALSLWQIARRTSPADKSSS